jgi:hypothetical protein
MARSLGLVSFGILASDARWLALRWPESVTDLLHLVLKQLARKREELLSSSLCTGRKSSRGSLQDAPPAPCSGPPPIAPAGR